MTVKHLVTAEELLAMPDPPGKRIELVDGEVIERPYLGISTGLIKTELLWTVGGFAKQHDLGLVVPGVGYVLRRGPDLVRAPDVSFIPWEHIPEGGIPEGYWEGPPALAVEIVLPDDLASYVRAKIKHFLEAGTRLVWVLWPQRQSMSVYTPDGNARELGPKAQLDGGDVLPGFTVRVADLFEIGHR